MRASAWRLASSEKSDESDEDPESLFALATGDGLTTESSALDCLERRQLEADVQALPKPLTDKLIFRFNLGMGLDGGQPGGAPRISGDSLDEVNDYQRLRIYGFGDSVEGSF